MKHFRSKLICAALCIALLLSMAPAAAAYDNTLVDLSGYIQNSRNRHFAESVLSRQLRENDVVRATLEGGLCALFFLEGCSDNMLDPELSDLSYYRVSAVCIALKLDEAGQPEVVYFNEDASTLPDRPLEFGAWSLEAFGEVGPATVCDGTYELYSVYHAGAYEALHLRSAYADDTIPAVYMTPEGYVISRANAINIHTRTGNHVIQRAMWSAGCMLVGDGEWIDFANLIVASYYTTYEKFRPDLPVGCVTINRQRIRQQLYALYENELAVDALLENSAEDDPGRYLQQCSQPELLAQTTMEAGSGVTLMTLPCDNALDARSVPVMELQEGDRVDVCAGVVNTRGELWYEVSFFGENCYVPASGMQEVPTTMLEWIARFFHI